MVLNHFRKRICLLLFPIICGIIGSEVQDYDKGGYVVQELTDEASDFEDVKTLFKNIFDNYDTRIRPRLNQSQSVLVDAYFVPNAIVNFDTTGQKMDVIGFFRVSWTDDITKWNASAFGGTNFLMVPLTDVWYPKLIIDKAHDGVGVIGDRFYDQVRISATGEVKWVPNGIYGFLCDADVTYYPNDVQTCDMQFYVTDQTTAQVILQTSSEVDLDDFSENSEWRLLNVKSSVKFKYGTNIVSVRFKIERRALFAIYTIIIPMFTLSVLSVATFVVPVESGEKGSLSITVFLAYGFFIALTRDSMPHNSTNIPYFLIYLSALLMFSVFTVLFVMLESKIHYTMGTRAVRFSRYFSLSHWLPKSVRLANGRQQSEHNKFSSSGNPDNVVKKNTRNTKYANANKVLPENTRVNIHNKEDNGRNFTWNDLLRITDTVLFCVGLLFLVIYGAVLWTKVINRED